MPTSEPPLAPKGLDELCSVTPLPSTYILNRVTLQQCQFSTTKIFLRGELIRYDTLTQWQSSVYSMMHEGTLPDTAVILRDQAEEYHCTGCNYIAGPDELPWSNIN